MCFATRPSVMRITLAQQLHGMALGRFRAGTKAHRALVEHEGVARQQVMPAARAGPHAEVVLLAVAAVERLDIELADIGERGAPDIHAEPDCGWHLDTAAAIGRAAGFIQIGHAMPERRWARVDAGIATDGRVVREGRHGCYARRRVGMSAKPREPAGSHLGVAVQQHDVIRARLPPCRYSPRQRNPDCAGCVPAGCGLRSPGDRARRTASRPVRGHPPRSRAPAADPYRPTPR